MNIDIPGRTGHDFDNKYDEENCTITWPVDLPLIVLILLVF